MNCSKAQIVATIGPASAPREIMRQMIEHHMDVIRFNFSWADFDERKIQIHTIRELENELKVRVPILGDLSGPRIQEGSEHGYDADSISVITDHDRACIAFGVEQGLDYFALSFVGSAQDVEQCREIIHSYGGNQRVIAKIERAEALKNLDEIIAAADGIMIARGDLGNEVPIEQIPFVQTEIIAAVKKSGKPVITATQMLTSMVSNPYPTRAEVTDVAYAILHGSDAVMLSEETSIGKYPVKAVAVMEKVIREAEGRMPQEVCTIPFLTREASYA